MLSSTDRAVLAHLLAEVERRGSSPGSSRQYDPRPYLTAWQGQAYADPSRWAAWPCGRRSGKTDLAEKVLTAVSTSKPGTKCFYVSTSIKRAKATVWDELVLLNKDRDLGGLPNHSELSIKFPNGTKLWVTGVENRKMANDLRGRAKVALYILDECQDWADDLLRYFYEQVVFPSLADVRGSVIFAGTGGPPKGFWYRVATSDPSFVRYTATPFDNPWLAEGEAQALVDKACKDRGVTVDDSSIQREFFAQFVADHRRQVFQVPETAYYDPEELPQGKWYRVMGVDVGVVDGMGYAVWGYTDESPHCWLLDWAKETDLGSTAQLEWLAAAYKKHRPFAIPTDPSAGGKALILDLKRRPPHLPMEVAPRDGKVAAILLMRDALRNGTIKIPRGASEFVQALESLEWDPDDVGKSLRGHSDELCDAALYGFRRTRFFDYKPPPDQGQGQLTPEERAMLNRPKQSPLQKLLRR